MDLCTWGNISECTRTYVSICVCVCVCVYNYGYIWGFSDGSDNKESASIRDLGSTLESGRSPGEGPGNPLQDSCLENPHGQRSLVGYTPCGRKESDTTERLNTCVYEGMCLYSCSDVCLCINNLCRYRYAYIGILCLPAYRYLSMCTMGCMCLYEGMCKCINGIHVCVYVQTYAWGCTEV